MAVPTTEQMVAVDAVIDGPLDHDQAVAKIVEITGWPEWQAAEWLKVGRTGYLDEEIE